MQQRFYFGLVRWIVAASAVALALLYFNFAAFSAWQTAAPGGYEYPEAWAYSAYLAAGHSAVFLCVAVLVAINVRPGWPHWRSKWNFLLLGGVVIAIGWPRAWHYLQIDRCLDAGSAWDYQYERCRSDT